MQETQTDLLTWNAAGRIEILAPDQSKINVSRCSLKIWRQKTSNLEL